MPGWFLEKTCEKGQNRKSEHNKILHNQISLGTKFLLKATLEFLDQINWKRVFRN